MSSCYKAHQITGINSPTADSGVILLSERSYTDAVSGCHALSEDLWSPDQGTENIQQNLDYLVYEGNASNDTQFWIASQGNLTRAVSVSGSVSTVEPGIELPVLCTQSAPFVNTSYTDNSTEWQISVYSNSEELVG